MRVDAYASMGHYADHLLPVMAALPDDVRGTVYSPRDTDWWGTGLPPRWRPDVVVVAGYADAVRAARVARRLVYVEHGAGQSYVGLGDADASYSGGRHDGLPVALYVAPSTRVADRWRARYPQRPVATVGSPILDAWHHPQARVDDGLSTLAWTWHWDCGIIPETRQALRHYSDRIGPLVAAWRAQGWTVLGTSHPRAASQIRRVWADVSVPMVDRATVLSRADVLLGDNTSLLYEFASLDRPVVCLNAPWYRRDVDHGLRFWDLVPGVQADDPDDLDYQVRVLTAGVDLGLPIRRRVIPAVYAACDGQAAARAAAAIVDAVGG